MRCWPIALAGLLMAGCTAQEPGNPADPSGYAVRLKVTPAPGGGLQRIDLPPEALAALRSPNRADIRIFDAANTPLPMAIGNPAGGRAMVETLRLPALPVIGPAGALTADGAELRVEQRAGDRVVTVVSAAPATGGATTLGALFDTRAITARARSLRLDAALPPQQPVSFTVESSRDLNAWTPVAEKILYRREAEGVGAIGPEAIALGDLDLKGRYLRVTWTSPQRLLAPVILRGGAIEVARKLDLADRPSIATTPPTRVDAHEVDFTLPREAILSAVLIEPTAGEMLVPVLLFGRNTPEQSWQPIGSGSLRNGAAATIELSGGAYSEYRIEADRRTPGFAKAPKLTLLFEPARVAVLFNGQPPFTLAAGSATSNSRYLAMGELIPDYRPGMEDALPRATVASDLVPLLSLTPAEEEVFSSRKSVLWALLLLGVAALGLMVWRLWRPKAG